MELQTSRPGPHRHKDKEFPSSHDHIRGLFDKWTPTTVIRPVVKLVSLRNTMYHRSSFVANPSTAVFEIPRGWRAVFQGCSSQDCAPTPAYENCPTEFGLIHRGSSTLSFFGQNKAGEYVIRLPFFNDAKIPPPIQIMKENLISIYLADRLKDCFQDAVLESEAVRSRWINFSFNSLGSYLVANNNSTSIGAPRLAMVQPYIRFNPNYDQRAFTINNPPLLLIKNPYDESLPSLHPLIQSDILLHDLLRAFVHYVFAKTSQRVLLTRLQGRYTCEMDLFVLSAPTIHMLSYQLSSPQKASRKAAVRQFVRHHKCNVVCSTLGLGKI